MIYEYLFIRSLILTIAAELAAGIVIRLNEAKLGFFKTKLKQIPLHIFIIGIILASTLTLPYVWFIFARLIQNKVIFIPVAELFAWLIEALFYKYLFKLKPSEAITFSFILNLFSFVLGLMLTQIL